MLEVSQALEIVLNHAKRLPSEITALTTSALGQITAEDLCTDLDSPPFTKAMMDGYAIRFADLHNGTAELQIIEEVAAGAMPSQTVTAGQAIAIYTGAPMPNGADTVVMKERCEVLANGQVRITDTALAQGKNVLPQGSEMHAGDVVIPAGTRLSPAVFGLCAAIGKTAIPTTPPPKIGVLVTGDELIEANMKPRGSQIRNTNGPMIVAQGVRAGALPRYLGIGLDQEPVLRSLIREGLTNSNMLILCGGVSAGKFDLVPGVLESLGVTIHFHQVRMKPGKPLLFGSKGDVLVFGLPGNPLSAYVGFELFVRPAIRQMAGQRQIVSQFRPRPLAKTLQCEHDRPSYQPARLHGDTGMVEPLAWFGSANLLALRDANSLIRVPAGNVNYPAGANVDTLTHA